MREGFDAPTEFRRFATVVNSDLKGSTALGERLDPESLREVLTLYFDEMRAIFEAHGGTIEKIIGDAIVAVFGLPVRHDDDALRAVEAAAESQRALISLNDRLEAAWGVRLVVRTGVATGDIIFGAASAGQHVLTGTTMQTATAMEQHAPPHEVLIAASTHEHVAEMVDVERVDPVTPRGTTDLVEAFRLVAVRERVNEEPDGINPAHSDGRVCPACGEDNPTSFRHCGTCGTTLAASVAVRDTRKTVTLVFADPKPATLDGAAPSAEALRDVMTRYFDAMRAALEQHGGTVEKFIGDAVMAVFGLPIRHEDDALRAIRAAAAMQAAIPALNDQFRANWGIELGNHIGVNTGEVIAGDARLGQRLVTGDAVNTAARLEQAAGPHETILGALTYRLARDHIEVEPIQPLVLKGKAEPVPAYRLLGLKRAGTDQAAQATPFVGRADELGDLELTLLEVEATRSCRLTTVIGEAGVGKSRLVREFAARASSRGRSQVLRGRCLPYGDGVTFWPIAEIVRSAADISDEDPPELALAKIMEVARGAPGQAEDLAGIADRVGSAIGLSTTSFPGPELFWGIRKLFEAMASRRPLVAIIDDIHVAAPTFLELLDDLLEAVDDAPVLLLTTARRELLETRADWAEAPSPSGSVLEPLSGSDADQIVEQLLSGLGEPVRQRIVNAAEGNPLYVEQISSMLIETGAVRLEEGAWIATGSSERIAIPPTVEALVAARLDALRSEERQVIDPASVIGLGFPVEALNRLVPQDAAADVPELLSGLTAKQFVRPSNDVEMYRFAHSVLKDTAYASMLKRTRATIHERFVDWAEPVNRERGRELEFEEILGYHLEQAYRFRVDLGAVDEAARGLGRRASQKLAAAGRRALGRGDLPAAASLLQRAVATRGTDDPERHILAPDLGIALMELGEFAAASKVLQEAGALAVEDPVLTARLQMVTCFVELYSGESDDWAETTAQAIDTALPVFERAGDELGQTLAWRLRSGLYGITGRWADMTDAAEEVIQHAGLAGDERAVTRAAITYATACVYGPTPVAEGIEQCEDLVDRSSTDQLAVVLIQVQLAQLRAMRGDFEQARALYVGARAKLEDLRAGIAAARTSIGSARVEMLAGDLPVAEAELRRDHDALTAMGERNFLFTVTGQLARVVLAQGHAAEAQQLASMVRAEAPAGDADAQVLWRSVLARVLADRSAFDEAVAMAEEAVTLRRSSDAPIDLAEALSDLADVLVLARRIPAARAAIAEALQLSQRKGDLVTARRLQARHASLVEA